MHAKLAVLVPIAFVAITALIWLIIGKDKKIATPSYSKNPPDRT